MNMKTVYRRKCHAIESAVWYIFHMNSFCVHSVLAEKKVTEEPVLVQ